MYYQVVSMRFVCATVIFAATVAVTSFGFTSAQAATVDVGYDMALKYTSRDGVRSNTSTYTTDLVGTLIEAVYTDGTTESWNWVRHNEWSGGTDHVSADLTMAYQWWGFEMQANKRLQSLEIDLAPASVIWDAGAYPEWDVRNTPTTYGGIPFHLTDGADALNGTVSATYSGLVQVGNNPVGEDAFTNLLIDFSGLEGSGLLGALTWAFDMDVLETPGDLTPVPLPASLLMLLAAMGIFVAVRAVPKRGSPMGALAA